MDDRAPDPTLEAGLRGLDWRRGLTGQDLVARLPNGDPFAGLIRQHLPAGPYFSPQDLLSALPASTREEARALPWRGGDTAGPTSAAAPASTTSIEQTAVGAGSPLAAGGPDPGALGPTDALRPEAGASSLNATGSETSGAEARADAASTIGAPPIVGLPERVRQTASQARDQVLSIRTRPAHAAESEVGDDATDRRTGPSVVATAIERLDRAVGDRPGKVGSFASLGLTLALILGLDALRGRRTSGAATHRVGRLRGLLLVAWAAAFAVNVWDLQKGGTASGVGAVGSTARRGPESTDAGSSVAAADAATDEYPTVNPR